MQSYFDHARSAPGAAPGIEHDEIAEHPGAPGQSRISCIDYCPDQVVFQEIERVEEFVACHRPEWTAVRWIHVDGLADTHAIQILAKKYDLHPLAVEDMLHPHQRPKVEEFGGEGSTFTARLFIVTQALRVREGRLQHEQVSIFLGHKTVLTFHVGQSSEWDAIRQRIKARGSRLRSSDASFLTYSLLDAIVDGCFPILEQYSERAEELEDLILGRPQPQIVNQVHQFKRDLMLMRWVIWPMRELVASLQREPHECVSETTRVYLRDLYDHVIQIIDLIETYREIAGDLIEMHMSSVSNRMSETMKVLTLIGTIFIPLTFLAGVYGTNFRHLPELEHEWAYPAFWAVCLLMAGAMVWLFRRRHWL
jgi:magnesium transporter